jgi:hypothetical protein
MIEKRRWLAINKKPLAASQRFLKGKYQLMPH